MSLKKIGGLGKGTSSLFNESVISAITHDAPTEQMKASAFTARISDIEPDKNQPRKNFDEESLESLAESIKIHGVLQPLVVRSVENPANDASLIGKYRIISGERRWRAAKLAGLTELPIVVKELSDVDVSAVMLVENLQREDLSVVETAKGLKKLIDEYGLTQEQASKIVGISRPNLTNSLRLLALPENVLDFLDKNEITAGHARALLSLQGEKAINEALDVILAKGFSVRDTEKYVKSLLNQKTAPVKSPVNINTGAYMKSLSERATESLGRKTKLIENKNKKGYGKLEIEFYGNDDLESLLKALCGNDFFQAD